MYKALVIGCGNIGAGYDFNNDQILTHSKAFHVDPRFSLSIFDVDKTLSAKISKKYECEIVNNLDEETLKKFDCVSICTPTDTHFELLNKVLATGVKVIVCEKPISNKLNELKESKLIYLNGKSKVLVNYFRRFQPSFIELKEYISKLLVQESLTNISIRYQRGFVNNCSHAFDTIEFLTRSPMELVEVKKHNIIFDHFDIDPTMSLSASWNKSNVCIIGLSNVFFSHFEFDLFFEYHKISIKDAGQLIEIYKAEKGGQFLQNLNIQNSYSRVGCLNNYMLNVINEIYGLLSGEKQKDNFLQSIELNIKLLTYQG